MSKAIKSVVSGGVGAAAEEEEPWKLSFEWNKKEHAAAPGGLLKDIWILIMTHYIDSSEDLIRFACSHPFFYAVVAQSVELQERAAAGQTFSEALSTKHFVMTKTLCRLQDNATTGSGSARERKVNTAIVDVKRRASPHHPVQVDFKLHSDFLTQNYVSYFNFALLSGGVDEDDEKESSFTFHYFVDGDVWDCDYDYRERSNAKWSVGDVITMQIGMVQLLSNQAQALLHGTTTRLHGVRHGWMRDAPHPSTKGAAVVLTPEQMQQGWTVYVALYRNYNMVYSPIVFQDKRQGHMALWVACKFAELKDDVELIKPKKLPRLVLSEPSGVVGLRRLIPEQVK